MKKLIMVVMLILLVSLNCSRDTVDSFKIKNKSSSKDRTKQITISSNAMPMVTASKIDCLPNISKDIILKSNHNFRGKINYSGKDFTIVGYFKIYKCNLNNDKTVINQKFSGICEDTEGDLLFYSGFIEVDISEEKYMGTMNFNSGTGIYADAEGVVPISGTMNLKNGQFDLHGEGSFNLN